MTTKARTLWAFALSSIAIFMTALDNLVVTTALPVIKRQLGGGIDALEWTVNGYTLTFAVLLLTGAALGDRFGRRRMRTTMHAHTLEDGHQSVHGWRESHATPISPPPD